MNAASTHAAQVLLAVILNVLAVVFSGGYLQRRLMSMSMHIHGTTSGTFHKVHRRRACASTADITHTSAPQAFDIKHQV